MGRGVAELRGYARTERTHVLTYLCTERTDVLIYSTFTIGGVMYLKTAVLTFNSSLFYNEF